MSAPAAVVIDGRAVPLDRNLVDVVGTVWHPTGYRDGRGWPLLRDLQPDESSAAVMAATGTALLTLARHLQKGN